MTTPISNSQLNQINGSGATSQTKNDAAAQDRFLKLLVAQMQNQDPLNPMDNAQVTSQMAQIQTVSGIESLNTNLKTMVSQINASQAMQGASLIGRDVLVPGDKMYMGGEEGKEEGRAAFELGGDASNVKVEIMDATGKVVDTIELGQLDAGRHHFMWAPKDGTDLQVAKYKVTATSGKAAVDVTSYTRETVGAVSTTPSGNVELDLFSGGTVAYDKVAAVVYH